MSDSSLPLIDIRVGRSSSTVNSNSIHSLPRQPRRNKQFERLKYPIVGHNSPLHQFIRVSLTNKTLVYKKRLCLEQARKEQNLTPLQYHQSNKVVIMKQTPRMSTEPSSQIRGNKSPLYTKLREKKWLFEGAGKTSKKDIQNQRLSIDSIILTRNLQNRKKPIDQFELRPWENQDFRVMSNQRQEFNRQDQFPSFIRHCL